MTKLSDARIALAALRGGFPIGEIPTAVAVAIAESDGDPLAVGVNKAHDGFPETKDNGVWQINSYWNPGLFSQYNWRDPDDNAKMAKHVWDEFVRADGQGWRGWSTFNSGSYNKYLARGRAGYLALHGKFVLTRLLFAIPHVARASQLMHGQDVFQLQRAIAMPGNQHDGYFGPDTEAAVKHFQSAQRITVDGVVGKETCKKLDWTFSA